MPRRSSKSRQFARVVDALVPAIAKFRGLSGDHALELSMLLPHLGFAHQELGEHDKALATFDEAYRLSPKDPIVTGYLIGANIAAKKIRRRRGAREEGAGGATPTT